MKSWLRMLGVSAFAAIGLTIHLLAQTTAPVVSVAHADEDARWSELQAALAATPGRGQKRASSTPARAESVTYFQQLETTAAKYLRSGQDAKRIGEATALWHKARLAAALMSDATASDITLAREAKVAATDPQLPTEKRYELALLSERLAQRAIGRKGREAWLAERAAAAQRLVAQFPEQPAARAELIEIASHCDDATAAALLAKLPLSASAEEKARATALVARAGLKGAQLAEVLRDVPGAAPCAAVIGRQPLLVVAWSGSGPWNERELALLRAAQTAGAKIFVVNVARTAAPGGAQLAASSVSAELLYGGAAGSPLEQRLLLGTAVRLCVTDARGVIRHAGEFPRTEADLLNLLKNS